MATKTTKTRAARISATAVALLTAASLTACGGDDSSDDSATTSAGADGAASGIPSMELSAVLEDYQSKAEELGYEDCMAAPDLDTGLTGLSCFGTEDPELAAFTLYDREDVGTGEDVAGKALDNLIDADETGSMSRETSGGYYRPVDGDDVAGTCTDMSKKCEKVIEDLGLEIGLLDGALNEEELAQHYAEEDERMKEEERAKAEKEEADRQEELKTYSGWDDLEEAKEQLGAWDIPCQDEAASNGRVAWCGGNSSLVVFDMSIDDLEDKGVFGEVGRDSMVKVSDGDWTYLCTQGGKDACDLVAEKTGESVKDKV